MRRGARRDGAIPVPAASTPEEAVVMMILETLAIGGLTLAGIGLGIASPRWRRRSQPVSPPSPR